ncbi:MAG: hypothetical protein AVDCRST_MAG49-1391 [uncultured Thermomicrobiales bacterium]|uniref:Integral membrane protein n=1 Tax=uncultured Thermomicrobiales bacterium TaxID=1645740 RepID=A0A6J4UDN3_9BACT|nr:MAG: hypothetical protein AVDCRST_MAG49-1391 [uncultured Thermomicrobiales bacterium]
MNGWGKTGEGSGTGTRATEVDRAASEGNERDGRGDAEPVSLRDEVSNILEEARMILPGTQTLFGFQLVVVFNATFQDRLSAREQGLHLAATALVAVATALLLTPAAWHRRVEPGAVSRRFVALSTRLLAWSLAPLALAICADVYLVATVVTGRWAVSLALALGLLLVFAALWFVLPMRDQRSRRG